MAQKKLNPKQGFQPILIYEKSAVAIREVKKKVDFLAKFFLLENTCEKPLQATA